MRTPYPAIFLLFGLAFFSGCADLPSQAWLSPADAYAKAQARQEQQYLAYMDHLRALTPAQLQAEHQRLLQAARQDGSTARLHLALLLSLPNTGFQDLPGAAKILNALARQGDQGGALAAFGNALLHVVAAQHQQNDQAAQQIRSLDQRLSVQQNNWNLERKRTNERIDALEQRLKQETLRANNADQRARKVESRLDALKRIEQNLNRRHETLQ